jgi:hypothetical protein
MTILAVLNADTVSLWRNEVKGNENRVTERKVKLHDLEGQFPPQATRTSHNAPGTKLQASSLKPQ